MKLATTITLSLFITLGIWPESVSVFPDRGPSLQETINQARSGTSIQLASGIYITDSAISIVGKTDLFIEGNGEVWIICTDVYENVIDIEDSNSIELSGIRARHEDPLDEYQCQGAVIHAVGSNNVEIYDCELNGSGAMGVSASDCLDLTISGCIIQFNSFTAVYLYGVDGVSITHNRIFDNAGTLEAYDSSDVELIGNVIANNAPFN